MTLVTILLLDLTVSLTFVILQLETNGPSEEALGAIRKAEGEQAYYAQTLTSVTLQKNNSVQIKSLSLDLDCI